MALMLNNEKVFFLDNALWNGHEGITVNGYFFIIEFFLIGRILWFNSHYSESD